VCKVLVHLGIFLQSNSNKSDFRLMVASGLNLGRIQRSLFCYFFIGRFIQFAV
jgi:hypothetical protein